MAARKLAVFARVFMAVTRFAGTRAGEAAALLSVRT
jgi:hypothetical protein